MIDNVIVLNLPSYQYRKDTMRGALKMLGWEDDRIMFWTAKDGRHFGDKENRPLTANVALSAIAVGFPFFKNIFFNADGSEKETITADLQLTAQSWNYCRVLRHISKTRGTYMVIHDDVVPRADYQNLCHLAKDLNHDGQFKFLLYQSFMTTEMIEKIGYPRAEMSIVPNVFEGIVGTGDKVWILNGRGADWALEITEEYYTNYGTSAYYDGLGEASVEYVIGQYINKPVPAGIYSMGVHRNRHGLGSHKLVRYLFNMRQDSAIMHYDDRGFVNKVEDTGHVPTIDWDYYENVLPKLQRWYSDEAYYRNYHQL